MKMMPEINLTNTSLLLISIYFIYASAIVREVALVFSLLMGVSVVKAFIHRRQTLAIATNANQAIPPHTKCEKLYRPNRTVFLFLFSWICVGCYRSEAVRWIIGGTFVAFWGYIVYLVQEKYRSTGDTPEKPTQSSERKQSSRFLELDRAITASANARPQRPLHRKNDNRLPEACSRKIKPPATVSESRYSANEGEKVLARTSSCRFRVSKQPSEPREAHEEQSPSTERARETLSRLGIPVPRTTRSSEKGSVDHTYRPSLGIAYNRSQSSENGSSRKYSKLYATMVREVYEKATSPSAGSTHERRKECKGIDPLHADRKKTEGLGASARKREDKAESRKLNPRKRSLEVTANVLEQLKKPKLHDEKQIQRNPFRLHLAPIRRKTFDPQTYKRSRSIPVSRLHLPKQEVSSPRAQKRRRQIEECVEEEWLQAEKRQRSVLNLLEEQQKRKQLAAIKALEEEKAQKKAALDKAAASAAAVPSKTFEAPKVALTPPSQSFNLGNLGSTTTTTSTPALSLSSASAPTAATSTSTTPAVLAATSQPTSIKPTSSFSFGTAPQAPTAHNTAVGGMTLPSGPTSALGGTSSSFSLGTAGASKTKGRKRAGRRRR